jgi:hypothetical protein
MMASAAEIAAEQFTMTDADRPWFCSDELADRFEQEDMLASVFSGLIRPRHFVMAGFKDSDRPNRVCIYLGLCSNGSLYHKAFKLGEAGTAAVLCEPRQSEGLSFQPVPLSQMRFLARFVRVLPASFPARQLPRWKFRPAHRKELRDLEAGLVRAAMPPFYGDTLPAADTLTRMRIRAAISGASRPAITCLSNAVVH